MAVVGGPEYLDRFLAVRDRLTSLEHLVVIDGDPPPEHRFADLLGADPVDLDSAVAATRPDDLLTVIYTSGTTGPPEGVMHTHRTFAWALEATTRAMGTTMTGWELKRAIRPGSPFIAPTTPALEVTTSAIVRSRTDVDLVARSPDGGVLGRGLERGALLDDPLGPARPLTRQARWLIAGFEPPAVVSL